MNQLRVEAPGKILSNEVRLQGDIVVIEPCNVHGGNNSLKLESPTSSRPTFTLTDK